MYQANQFEIDYRKRLLDKIDMLQKRVQALEEELREGKQTLERQTSFKLKPFVKLQEELEKVKTDKDLLRSEIEEKTSKCTGEYQILAEKFEALIKVFEDVKKENSELKRRLKQLTMLEKENQVLKDEMGNLKADHDKLREKLECKETRLALGQVAWLLEAEIWEAVLPDERMGTTAIFKSMERWLKKNSSSPEGKAAQKRWDDLKDKMKWDDDDHRFALSLLKKLRIKDAHPEPVDLEEARIQLKEGNYVAAPNKKSCEEIIDMIKIARNLKSN